MRTINDDQLQRRFRIVLSHAKEFLKDLGSLRKRGYLGENLTDTIVSCIINGVGGFAAVICSQ